MLAKQELARLERNKPNKNADPTILTKDNQIDIQKAVGRNYADFWNSKDRYLVLKGSRSSKKYDVVPNTLVIRRFFNTHKDSTFALLNKVINRFGVAHKWKVTMNPMQLTYLPSGGKVIFKGEPVCALVKLI